MHKDCKKAFGLPDLWPSEVVELRSPEEESQYKAPWVIMGLQEYQDHLAAQRPKLDWYLTHCSDDRGRPHKYYSFKGIMARFKSLFRGTNAAS